MNTKLTNDEARAKSIAENPTLLLATAGGIKELLAKENRRRLSRPIGHSYELSSESREEKKSEDQFSQIVRTAMLRNIVATASNLALPGPYAVRATPEKPYVVKDKHGNVQYIDDGMSCKNPFNTKAAAPVPGAQNTFKLETPKKRSEMSFAESVSTPVATYYAQIGAQSAIPSTDHLHATFASHTKPQSFADVAGTNGPTLSPGFTPSDAAPITTKSHTARHHVFSSPAPLELNLH